MKQIVIPVSEAEHREVLISCAQRGVKMAPVGRRLLLEWARGGYDIFSIGKVVRQQSQALDDERMVETALEVLIEAAGEADLWNIENLALVLDAVIALKRAIEDRYEQVQESSNDRV